MSTPTLVTVVIGVFFLIGIAVGVVLVIAISALRTSAERARPKLARYAEADDWAGQPDTGWPDPGPSAANWTGAMQATWEEPPDPAEDDDEDGKPPRWPRNRGLLAGGG